MTTQYTVQHDSNGMSGTVSNAFTQGVWHTLDDWKPTQDQYITALTIRVGSTGSTFSLQIVDASNSSVVWSQSGIGVNTGGNTYPTNITVNPNVTLKNGGTYHFQFESANGVNVTTFNETNASLATGQPGGSWVGGYAPIVDFNFTWQAPAPTAPVITNSPATGATVYAGDVLTINWNASTFAAGTTGTYSLWYTTDGGANYTQITTGVSGTSYAWTLPLVLSSSMQFLVQADQSDGQQVSSALSNSFTVAEHAVHTPTWNTANNTLFQTTTPQLSFQGTPGYNGDTITDAHIDIANDSAFSSMVLSTSHATSAAGWTGIQSAAGGGAITYTPATGVLAYGKTYYARVNNNQAGDGTWSGNSSTLTFTVDAPPNPPTWNSPANNAGNTMNPNFRMWAACTTAGATDTITDAEVQIASDSGFATIVQDKQYSTSATGWQGLPTSAGGGTVYYTIQTALAPGTYYIRLRTKDNNGLWSSWTSTLQVTVVAATFTNAITANQTEWKTVDITELRGDIDNARAFRGLGSYSYADLSNLASNPGFETFTGTATVFSDALTSYTGSSAAPWSGTGFAFGASGATVSTANSVMTAGNSAWKPLTGSGGQNLALTAQATFTLPATLPTSDTGLMVRLYQDTNNCYMAYYSFVAKEFLIAKEVGGTWTSLGNSAQINLTAGSTYTITLAKDANNIVTGKLYSGSGTGGTNLSTLTSAADTSLSGGFLIGVGGDTGVVISSASVTAPFADGWGISGDSRVAWALTQTNPISGETSVIAQSYAGFAGQAWIIQVPSATSGSQYVASMYAEASSGSNAIIELNNGSITSASPSVSSGAAALYTTPVYTQPIGKTAVNLYLLITGPGTYTFDAVQLEQVIAIRAVHVNDLRTALADVLSTVGVTPNWSDANPLVANQNMRRGQHLLDIRTYLQQT